MTCNTCGGELLYLGKLGSMHWMRCEDCGMDQSRHAGGDAPYDLRDSESLDDELEEA